MVEIDGFVIPNWVAVTLKGAIFDAPDPVPPIYFSCIFEGLIPPGLFMIFAHLGMCL